MHYERSFRFAEDNLNRLLIALLKQHAIKHSVDEEGVIHYAPEDEEAVENDLIPSIRDRLFDDWQVLSCPKEDAERYQHYMARHDIPFKEERIDGQLCFLLPRKYRPHRWKLEEAVTEAP
jgi:hypothetical protein